MGHLASGEIFENMLQSGSVHRLFLLLYSPQVLQMLIRLSVQGRPQDLGGGAKNYFQICEFACRKATCYAWRSHAHCKGGSGACSPEKFFENGAIWCVLGCIFIRFCLYFFFKNYDFLYKNFFLDTHLLWGISHEEIFENMLRLMRFDVYFETAMAIFIKK